MDRVVATNLVVRHALILTGVFIFVEALSEYLSKWIELFIGQSIILVMVCLIGVNIVHLLNGAIVHETPTHIAALGVRPNLFFLVISLPLLFRILSGVWVLAVLCCGSFLVKKILVDFGGILGVSKFIAVDFWLLGALRLCHFRGSGSHFLR